MWAFDGKRRVGFINFEIDARSKTADIQDIYIDQKDRRSGYGTEIMQSILKLCDQNSIECIELNVRRDNPAALAFWEKQRFITALYRMRMYRNPDKSVSFVGSLSSDFADNNARN